MSQVVFDDIVASAKSGTQLAADLNNFKDALLSLHSGVSRPPYAQAGTMWSKEVSGTQVEVYLYDGANDILLYTYNPVTSELTQVPLLDGTISAAALGADVFSGLTAATPTADDKMPFGDTSDSGNPKQATLRETVGVLLPGYLSGFVMSNNSTDATNDIDVKSGAAVSDDAAALILSSGTITKQIDVTFAEYSSPSTPSGGRDSSDNLTGAKWFNVYMIWGSGKNAQPFFSTSASPTLPTGFTKKRRIGSIHWTGTTIRAFHQDGDEFTWKASVLDVSVTNPGATAVHRILTVPTGVRVTARINVRLFSSTSTPSGVVSSPDANDEAPSSTAAPLVNITTISTSAAGAFAMVVRTDTSAQIRTRMSSSDAATSLQIATTGYTDTRGK